MPKAPTRVAILAGGSGTRFWPAGRKNRPKQMLALDGKDKRPLVRATVDRLKPLSPFAPWIIAPRSLERPLQRLLPELDGDDFLWEPEAKNTAAAVGLAAAAAYAEDDDAPLLVVPADHHVAPLGRYRSTLRAMARRAAQADCIVTLGLKPDRPATGLGYLQRGKKTASSRVGSLHAVERYIEKPGAAKARRLVKDGRHSWNGGTFAFRPSVFLAELGRHLPDVFEPLRKAFKKYGRRGFAGALRRAYAAMPSISVDYGVMEKASAVEVLVSDIAWDDLGSWDAVARQRKTDAAGNSVHGDATLVDAKDCVVDVDEHVALLGVKDLIVVRHKGGVLVAKRGRGEDVRAVVERLERAGREDLLS